ncbi:hypothetical protein A1O3_02754 [Capronia epimyces CBS 606.96]|uniref:Succinate dehydrogenase assembly factor 4, mitochondrial n=1 Tax=Capronia epimyces CBS 606.96 TaxID=1182542 RepID=W9YA01_9EURO|nr:uncharacterized protein A1O3_02754 [Capronia epimyces CBS 606.96]EXJ89687.1 hypothetical protein A1O3_02754 [Capronia epimyces CBS 606.96]
MKPATSSLRHLSSAPRAHLFSHRCPCRCRRISTTASLRSASSRSSSSPSPAQPSAFSFGGPAPPRLPKEEQEIFESLQRASTGAFSTPRAPPRINQSPDLSDAEAVDAQATVEARVDKIQTGIKDGERTVTSSSDDKSGSESLHGRVSVIEAAGRGEELHPNVVRGAEPEFEGDVNPKTGEVGGPKNEPLRWGPAGEWTYNGRTTDF